MHTYRALFEAAQRVEPNREVADLFGDGERITRTGTFREQASGQGREPIFPLGLRFRSVPHHKCNVDDR